MIQGEIRRQSSPSTRPQHNASDHDSQGKPIEKPKAAMKSQHKSANEAPVPSTSSSGPARSSPKSSSGSIEKTAHSGDLSDLRATPSQRRPRELDEIGSDDGIEVEAKRTKSSDNEPKALPSEYENCTVSDLVQVICEMLIDLIRINDPLPLQEGGLTRFHSRAPPAISVLDYLHRLATHATLSPPILLSMVYYIDKLCALYPAFTISSLTVHRFLIASATVASKGLSDAFWTNSTYARVGGVSIRELALLELELLWRIDWRIVPQPEVLTEYYKSLVTRSDGFKLEPYSGPNAVVPAGDSSTMELIAGSKPA